MPDHFGDVVVLLPGIFGSRLERIDGRHRTTIYDLSLKTLPSTLWSLGTDKLMLPPVDRAPDDGIVATELFNHQILPGFFGVDDYQAIVSTLHRVVKTPDQQLIAFPYDWRASSRYAAERLETVANDALTKWRAQSGNAQAKLWLVCHSMGGLVARYFCEHLGGSKITRALITIGTPHRGSAKALGALVNGYRLGPIDLTNMLRSLPSVYELLPQYPVIQTLGAKSTSLLRLPDVFGFGDLLPTPNPVSPAPQAIDMAVLAGIDPSIYRRALEFHSRIRSPALARADAGKPPSYRMEAFINRRQKTESSAEFSLTSLIMIDTYWTDHSGSFIEEDLRGDGTVPSFAAIPIEWTDTSAAVFVAEKHVAMPAASTVCDSIYNWMRPLQARQFMGDSTADAEGISLSVPPYVKAGEDMVIELEAPTPAIGEIIADNLTTGNCQTQRFSMSGANTARQFNLGGVAEGGYRVTVTPTNRLRSRISDFIVVL